MKKNLITAILMTLATTLLLGIVYPLVVTTLAQMLFHDKANGQLISRDGKIIGSRILAQPFTGAEYFHPRASAAGTNGYDAANSGGSNYGPTNQKLVDRIQQDVAAAQKENPGHPIPVDYITTSASGLDPDISPANALFQLPRVAAARKISTGELDAFVKKHIQGRQFGLLGEPRINVLELNLDLDAHYPKGR
jgi:K+-transporting ATPase ATPase C chain